MTCRRFVTGASLVAAALTGAALAGCSTGGTPATHPAARTTSAPPPTPVTSTPVTSAPAPSTSAATRTKTAATTVPTPPANSCKNMTVRVLQGGAVQQAEIAAVTFVNASSTACSISGYPSVVLLHNGSTLTTATPKSGTVAQAVRLAPGAQAESRITDHSTCNADLSDAIEVTAPNGAAGGKLTRPFQLRGCAVDVTPVQLSS